MSWFKNDQPGEPTCQAIFGRADGGPDEDCDRENSVHIVHSNKNGRWAKVPGGVWVMPHKKPAGDRNA